MNKLKTMLMAGAVLLGAAQTYGEIVECSTWADVRSSFSAGNDARLASDVTVDSDISIQNASRTLYLNGKTVYIPSSQRAALLTNGSLTLEGDGTVTRSDSGAYIWGGSFVCLNGASTFTMNGGTITGLACNRFDDGGIATVRGTSVFIMNGGTIRNCSATSSGGAVRIGESNARFIMNGGTITGCTASSEGGAVYSVGSVTINGGVIVGCSAGTASTALFGGSGTTAVNGGVSDSALIGEKAASGKSCEQVGANYIVGTNIASDSDGKLTAGTYTFCPTNAEFAAVGVAVAEKVNLLVNASVTPQTWTVTEYNIAKDEESAFKPTQIVNGGFDDEAPWMDFTLNGVRQTRANQTSAAPSTKPYGVTVTALFPNGVDEGWNTTEDKVQYGTLFQNITTSYTVRQWRTINNMTYSPFSEYGANDLYTESVAKGYGNALEMNCQQAATLYQDLTTHGGDVIRWTLLHGAFPNYDHPMIVSVGAPERDASGEIVPASGVGVGNINNHITAETKAVYSSTGVTGYSGGHGNAEELAPLSLTKTQTTHWYTCKGVYVIPDGQTVTRFAFESQAETKPDFGNLLDNVTFSTLIGNLKALVNDDGSVTITGYWGDDDTAKKLMIKYGEGATLGIDMSSVANSNFSLVLPAEKIAGANMLEVYHEDYESVKRTVSVCYPVTLHLNAEDATCAKLETYQRGVVTALPIPTRPCYRFKGWFDNEELAGAAVTQIEADAVGAKAFYAKWRGPGVQVGDDAWAYVENGLCEVYGTGPTWDSAPLDAEWANISDVEIVDGVTGVGEYFFYKFYNLTNVTVAASCTSLARGALFNCLSLEQVTFEGDMPTRQDNALNVHAGIRMDGDTPVVYPVPNVTVKGKALTLMGSNDLKTWEAVESGNEKNYHFFKFVLGEIW